MNALLSHKFEWTRLNVVVGSRLVPARGGPATDSDDPDDPDLKIPKNPTKPVILVLHRFYINSPPSSTVQYPLRVCQDKPHG